MKSFPYVAKIVLYNVGPEDDQTILRVDYAPQVLPAMITRVINRDVGVVDLKVFGNNGPEAPVWKRSVFYGKGQYQWMCVEDLTE